MNVIVHADDFGETVEITRGICIAIEQGAVTSTTIMANMPGTTDALARVAGLADRASFGVHINLCEGVPLTGGRTLISTEGRFHRKRELFLRAITGRLSSAEVEAEIQAQIQRVHDAGVRISHVDGHKHLHQLPEVNAAVARVLPRFGIERVRLTRLRRVCALQSASALVRETLARRSSHVFRRAGLRSPARTLDIGTLMREDAFAGWLGTGSGTLELMCHPGTEQADREKPGSRARHDELSFLLSSRFRELLAAAGARPVTYWHV